MFAAVDQPTVFTSHCAAYSLPSVLTACASVFHEITWLNLQARGCVIACKCVFVRVCVCRAPSASKWTWDCAKKGEVRQLLAKSNCDPAGGNRCHYLPAWLLAPAPRWKKPVLEKTTQVEGHKGVNLFIFPFCKLGRAAFLLKCILVVIVLHTSLKNDFNAQPCCNFESQQNDLEIYHNFISTTWSRTADLYTSLNNFRITLKASISHLLPFISSSRFLTILFLLYRN